MKVSEFIKLFNEEDLDKELCIYDIETGERKPLSDYDVDFDNSDVVDININN